MQKKTAWTNSKRWYDQLVGQEGHYYHQQVILPRLLEIIKRSKPKSLIDLACGQGVLARHLPPGMNYLGLDAAPNLISQAKQYSKDAGHQFAVHDVTQPYEAPEKFDFATILLALQNIEAPQAVIQNAADSLKKNGQLVIILNHPCFRVPRQSSWGVDEQKKCQFRRIDRYMSPLEVPIQMQPSKGEQSTTTWSFHYPLQFYFQWLNQAKLSVVGLEEWCSNKKSQGGHATMENRARDEIPLFLALVAKKD